MFYFAYGMNTNRDSMARRCPGAISMGSARLLDHEFRFDRHADVVSCPGRSVSGVLWIIDDEHLQDLDNLEGYPYYYDRKILPVEYHDNIVMSECYRMQPDNMSRYITDEYPSQGYLDMLFEGYLEHNIPDDQIFSALDSVAQKQQNFVAKIPQKFGSFL